MSEYEELIAERSITDDVYDGEYNPETDNEAEDMEEEEPDIEDELSLEARDIGNDWGQNVDDLDAVDDDPYACCFVGGDAWAGECVVSARVEKMYDEEERQRDEDFRVMGAEGDGGSEGSVMR